MTSRYFGSFCSILVLSLAASVFQGCGSSSRSGGGIAPTNSSNLAISTAGVPQATQGQNYETTLQAVGGSAPFNWTISSGTLPPGIALLPDGRLSGVGMQTGNFSFRVRVNDSLGQAGERDLILTVAPPLTLSPSTVPDGTSGQPYSVTFQGGGGTPPYTYQANQAGLPPGTLFDAPTATLSGMPNAPGSYSVNVTLRDASGFSTTKNYTLVIQ